MPAQPQARPSCIFCVESARYAACFAAAHFFILHPAKCPPGAVYALRRKKRFRPLRGKWQFTSAASCDMLSNGTAQIFSKDPKFSGGASLDRASQPWRLPCQRRSRSHRRRSGAGRPERPRWPGVSFRRTTFPATRSSFASALTRWSHMILPMSASSSRPVPPA